MEVLYEWSFSLGMPGGIWVAGGLCGILATWSAVDVLRMWRVLRGPRRALLLCLRFVTALFALLLILQPQWLLERMQQDQGRVAVLLDVSRSMALPDGDGSRADSAKAVLARLGAGISDLSVFTFGADVEPSAEAVLLQDYPVADDETRIGEALSSVQRAMGPELGALVIVSDGSDSSGGVDSEVLRGLRTRVHAVLVGGSGPPRDDAIVEVRADPMAFLRQQAEVEVEIRRTPAVAGTINVSLRSAGALLTEVAALVDDDGRGRVVIPFDASKLGRTAYTVSIPVAEGDRIPQNNERAFLMRVKRDRLRVLLVCGRPSWDARFLRAFLKGNPGIDLITFFILRTANDMSMAAPDELALIPFPTDELFREHLESFDLVVFQDFNYGPYQMGRYLPRIRDYVLHGGAFAMVGGELSFSAGGYADTPVAEILPVDLPVEEPTLSTEVFRPHVADGMWAHPLVELVPSATDNALRWSRLAMLPGSNLLGQPKKGATVLLVHPTLRLPDDGTQRPVLVVGGAGSGRTLALAVDSSYRWGISTAGVTGDASTYDRFWDRALRWLTRDPLLEATQVRTDRERYGPGAQVKAEFLVRDDRYVPAANGQVTLSIVDSDGQIRDQVPATVDVTGRGAARLTAPVVPGAYRVAVAAGDIEAEEAFVVEAGGQEFSEPFPNRGLLKRIAERTGGTFYESPALDPAGIERSRTRSLGVERKQLLGSPVFFVALVGVFVAEWTLRRRWGLR